MIESAPHDRIENRADYLEFLQADLVAHGLSRWRWWRRYTNPELHYQRILRRTEYFSTKTTRFNIFYILNRLRLARLSVATGISVPPGVFGRGLSIAHHGSIVVNNEARVGQFCRLHSATNIGVGKAGCPVLGDFVYVAPGAVISGGVKVGSLSLVGANSVVLTDIPEGSVAVGAPARVASRNTSFGSMPSWIQLQMKISGYKE